MSHIGFNAKAQARKERAALAARATVAASAAPMSNARLFGLTFAAVFVFIMAMGVL